MNRLNYIIKIFCSARLKADQTPTPTKFLRTCEEMGLFPLISGEPCRNPFDQDFKKAAQSEEEHRRGLKRKAVGGVGAYLRINSFST